MKKRILTGLVLTLALVVALGAACTQTATNGNTAMNHNSMMMNSNSMTNMNGMNHNSMMNGNQTMDHNSMMNHSEMKSSPNAASAPYDLQFIDTMTMHHQGAIEMAKMAVEKTQNAELKAFAQKIIKDQEKEIAQMKEWREKWFAGKPQAVNMEMDGMDDSMKGMDMKKLGSLSGKEFDLEFINQMTPHHDGAVEMAKEALTKAERPEIKTLSNQIIKEQEEEIKKMQAWKTAWSK